MSASAVILIRERKIAATFRDASATSPETARSLADLGLRDDLAASRLRRRGVLRETKDGRYYFDIAAWEALRGDRLRRAAVALVLVAIAFGVVLWLNRAK